MPAIETDDRVWLDRAPNRDHGHGAYRWRRRTSTLNSGKGRMNRGYQSG